MWSKYSAQQEIADSDTGKTTYKTKKIVLSNLLSNSKCELPTWTLS